MTVLSLIPIIFSLSSIFFIQFYFGSLEISLKIFYLFLGVYLGWLCLNEIIKKKNLRYSINLFISITIFYFLSFLNFNFKLLLILNILLIFLYIYFIREKLSFNFHFFSPKNILFVLGISFICLGVFSAIIIYYQYSFIFIERLSLSGHHIDNLFHISISNIIKTYNTTSLGVYELQPLEGYYYLSNYLIAAFSKILNMKVFNFINYGVFIFFIPIFILSLVCLIKDLNFKINKFEIFFIFLIFLFGWFPSNIIENTLDRHAIPDYNHINSIVGFIFINFLSFMVFQMINKNIKTNLINHFIVFSLWLALVKTKMPFAISMAPGIIFFYLFSFFEKNNFIKIYKIIFILSVLFIIFDFSNTSNVGYNPSIKDFGYFYYNYAYGSILLIIFVTFLPIVAVRDFKKDTNTVFFLKNYQFEIFYIFSFFIFLIYSLFYRHTVEYAPVHYFQDLMIYMSALYFLLNFEFIKNKYLKNKSMLVFFVLSLLIINNLSLISKRSHQGSVAYLDMLKINNTTNLNYKEKGCYKLNYERYGEKNKYFIEITKNIPIFHDLYCTYLLRQEFSKEIIKFQNNNNEFKIFVNRLNNLGKFINLENKSEFLIYIDNYYYSELNEVIKTFMVQQFTEPLFMIVPAVTGIAQIHGKRTKNRLPGFGSITYDKFILKDYTQINQNNICDQLKTKVINKIIFIDKYQIFEIVCK